jgi:hypothetical protein
MGEVYKTRDMRLDRIVAVKASNQQLSERFEREARAVAALCSFFDRRGPDYSHWCYWQRHDYLSVTAH